MRCSVDEFYGSAEVDSPARHDWDARTATPQPGRQWKLGCGRSGHLRDLVAEHGSDRREQRAVAPPAQRIEDLRGQSRAHEERAAKIAQLAGIQHVLELAGPRPAGCLAGLANRDTSKTTMLGSA
jgi:hypothetical protein